jgi:hypothetical protein
LRLRFSPPHTALFPGRHFCHSVRERDRMRRFPEISD